MVSVQISKRLARVFIELGKGRVSAAILGYLIWRELFGGGVDVLQIIFWALADFSLHTDMTQPFQLSYREIELLKKPLLSKIATIGRDGYPQITQTGFMLENGKFIISTPQKAVKVRNIQRNPRVSVLVDDGYKYVAVKGRAKINTERDVVRDTETITYRYMGKEKGKPIVDEILKIKHVIVEIAPESSTSSLSLKFGDT